MQNFCLTPRDLLYTVIRSDWRRSVQACPQFLGVERLGQIIVRAGFEAREQVLFLIARSAAARKREAALWTR
jgi:hypothetical protein